MTAQLFSSTKSTVALREKLIRCFNASEELIASAVENYESQPERTIQTRLVLSRQLLSVLDELLRYDDWESSPFINQLLKPTRHKRLELIAFIDENSGKVSKKIWQHPVCPAGSTEAYILLYQTAGENIRGWESQICDLHRMAVSRPLYANKEDVERCMHFRGDQLTDAYALLHLPEGFLQPSQGENKDKYGQELLQFRKTNLSPGFIKAFYYQGDIYELHGNSLIKMRQQLNKEELSNGS